MQSRAVVYKERESGTGGDFELKETVNKASLMFMTTDLMFIFWPRE
jgi:hypothetical protein